MKKRRRRKIKKRNAGQDQGQGHQIGIKDTDRRGDHDQDQGADLDHPGDRATLHHDTGPQGDILPVEEEVVHHAIEVHLLVGVAALDVEEAQVPGDVVHQEEGLLNTKIENQSDGK